MWIILSLFSAVFESAKDTFGKKAVYKTDEYTSALSLHLFTLILSVPVIIFTGIPKLTPEFWWGSLLFLPITPLWSVSYMKALRLSPLSEVLPMMAFNPIMTALLAFVFEGKGISILGWLGVLLISFGMYAVHLKPETIKHNPFTPIKHAFSNRGSQYMLFVAFLWSIGAYLSKWRVDGSSPLFSTMTSGFIGVISTYILALMLKKTIDLKAYLSHRWQLFPIGLFYYLANLSSGFALATGRAAYVFSIKRASIIASALTGKLFFHETISKSKLFGLVLICLGILFLSLR